jgi:hypothetical protein
MGCAQRKGDSRNTVVDGEAGKTKFSQEPLCGFQVGPVKMEILGHPTPPTTLCCDPPTPNCIKMA